MRRYGPRGLRSFLLLRAAFRPAKVMAANSSSSWLNIPKNIHGFDVMSQRDLEAEARKQESINYSCARRKAMTHTQRHLCAALGESRSLWYALRRHGTEAKVEEWLQIMAKTIRWREQRQSQEEILRREYLHLLMKSGFLTGCSLTKKCKGGWQQAVLTRVHVQMSINALNVLLRTMGSRRASGVLQPGARILLRTMNQWHQK